MNIIAYITIGALSLGIFSQIKTNTSVRDTQTPKYEVLKTFDQFEIRKYPEMIMASASLGNGTYSDLSSKGFRTVASYIFGNNDAEKKISMTSPVVSTLGKDIKMSFIMPSEYEIEQLPNPNNKNVKIQLVKEKTLAVIGFSGFANDSDIKEHSNNLKILLKKSGIENTGQVFFYGYNPPYQLLNRTNEIAIEIIQYEK